MARNCKIALALAALLMTAGAVARAGDEVTLEPTDRILILAPHPDDEAVGCGGIIQKAVAMGLPLRVVFLTYGDNNEWSFLVYRKHPVLLPRSVRLSGAERHDEAVAAARTLGVRTNQLTFLGYPDYGTLAIWYTHWGDEPPFHSMLTRVRAVPYATALRPGAPYKGDEILRDLTFIFRKFKPTKIFVSHPADHNQDHRALYLFTRIALWDLESVMKPQVYPYLVHFPHWPKPRGLHLDDALTPPMVLKDQLRWQTAPLTPEQVGLKLTALKKHRSQWLISRGYLESFVRTNELFSDYPAVSLLPAPHAAKERFSLKDAPAVVEMPEELTEEERAAFVGMEWKNARIESNALVVTVELSRPLANAVKVSLFAFGYRSDRPFVSMPKIQVRVAADDVDAFDQARHLRSEEIQVTRGVRQISARIPLSILGNPTRILTSARTYLADVPLDWFSWRVLELPAP